jgi:hypothetical protein
MWSSWGVSNQGVLCLVLFRSEETFWFLMLLHLELTNPVMPLLYTGWNFCQRWGRGWPKSYFHGNLKVADTLLHKVMVPWYKCVEQIYLRFLQWCILCFCITCIFVSIVADEKFEICSPPKGILLRNYVNSEEWPNSCLLFAKKQAITLLPAPLLFAVHQRGLSNSKCTDPATKLQSR